MKGVGRFIRQIYRISGTYSQRVLKDEDISTSAAEALRIIYHHKDISQQGLAAHLSIDKAAVARLVASLEEKGYICRGPDEFDKRIKRIYITEKGEKTQFEIRATEQEFYEWLFCDIEDDEKEKFMATFEKIAAKAKEEKRNGFQNLLK